MLNIPLISIFFSLIYTIILIIYFVSIFCVNFLILTLFSFLKIIYLIDLTAFFQNINTSYFSSLFKFLIEFDLNFYKKLHTNLDLTVYELKFVNIYEYFLVRFFMKILGAIISTFVLIFYLILPIKSFYIIKRILTWFVLNSALNTIPNWDSNLKKFKLLLKLNIKQILIYSGVSAILGICLILTLSNFFYYKQFTHYNCIQNALILHDNNNYIFYNFCDFSINIYFLTVIGLFIVLHCIFGVVSIIYDYLKTNAFEIFVLFFIIVLILLINLLIIYNENILFYLIKLNFSNVIIITLLKFNFLLLENTNYGLMHIFKW